MRASAVWGKATTTSPPPRSHPSDRDCIGQQLQSASPYDQRVRCFYCGRTVLQGRHPPEHILPAAVGATLITDKVCSDCNRRAGSEVDWPWQNWPLIMELRHRFAVLDRDGKPARPVTWPGQLVSGDARAAVDVKGERVDVRILPSEYDEDGVRVFEGDEADLAKRRQRILRKSPDARIVPLPSRTLPGPLSAKVEWTLSVHIWPRFMAKVALGVASLIAEEAWVETQEAAQLRRVLWTGDQSTVDTEMLPHGKAWSIAPVDLTGLEHPLNPPEHLIRLEWWQEQWWVVLVAFGTFQYGVPVSFGSATADQPVAWLFEPLAHKHTPLTANALQAELERRMS